MAIPVEQMQVALGAHNIRQRPPLVLKVESIMKHPKYVGEKDSYKNDIAVMKLKQPVKFTQDIAPVCLPPITLQRYSNLIAAG